MRSGLRDEDGGDACMGRRVSSEVRGLEKTDGTMRVPSSSVRQTYPVPQTQETVDQGRVKFVERIVGRVQLAGWI